MANIFCSGRATFANTKDDRTSGIYLVSLDGKEQKLVLLCHSSFDYDSHNLYYADDQTQLVRVAFDPARGKVSGEPVRWPIKSDFSLLPTGQRLPRLPTAR